MNINFQCPGCENKRENGPDHLYYLGNGYTEIIIKRYTNCKLNIFPIIIDNNDLDNNLFMTLPKRKAPEIPLDQSLPSSSIFINKK